MKKIILVISMLALGVMVQAQTIMPVPFLSRISGGDTTPNYLFNKLVAGTGITLTKNNPGANETITIDSAGGTGVSNAYASSTFVTYPYASSTFASTSWILSTYPNFNYGSTTYVNYSYASSTFASTSWVTSSFPSFSYASTTFASTSWVRSTFPTFTYATSTFVPFSYATSTFAPKVAPSFTGTSTFVDIRLTGGFYDSVNGIGAANRILRSTGTSTQWVATSSLFGPITTYTGTYPIIVTGSVISTGFSTSTTNVFSAKQTFANSSSTSISTSNLYATGTISLATTTLTGDLTVSGNIPNRVVGYTASSTITINVDTTDEATTTVNQTTTFANPTGTAIDGFMYLMTLRATTTQTVSWGSKFASSTDLSFPTSIASGTTEVLWKYDKFRDVYMLLGLLKTFMN